jgi:hypothetical protein
MPKSRNFNFVLRLSGNLTRKVDEFPLKFKKMTFAITPRLILGRATLLDVKTCLPRWGLESQTMDVVLRSSDGGMVRG